MNTYIKHNRHSKRTMHSDNGRPTNITTDQTLNWSHAQTDKVLSRLRNDLYCVEWGVKLYSLTHGEITRHTLHP